MRNNTTYRRNETNKFLGKYVRTKEQLGSIPPGTRAYCVADLKYDPDYPDGVFSLITEKKYEGEYWFSFTHSERRKVYVDREERGK